MLSYDGELERLKVSADSSDGDVRADKLSLILWQAAKGGRVDSFQGELEEVLEYYGAPAGDVELYGAKKRWVPYDRVMGIPGKTGQKLRYIIDRQDSIVLGFEGDEPSVTRNWKGLVYRIEEFSR